MLKIINIKHNEMEVLMKENEKERKVYANKID
jgi:hypothetical protein